MTSDTSASIGLAILALALAAFIIMQLRAARDGKPMTIPTRYWLVLLLIVFASTFIDGEPIDFFSIARIVAALCFGFILGTSTLGSEPSKKQD